MGDVDQAFLESQRILLTEIRDELRATRGMSASAGSGGMSGGAARPGHTFVAAQAAADRTLLGQWSSFGWSAAYQPNYHSTLFGDLSAMIGFNRAPQTLTQEEFRGLAGQNIAARASNFAMGMIAPGYVASTNALADDIFRNSSRFIRSGNPNAGVMGTGFDYGVARQISRSIQHEALGDLRMSGTDYSTITSLGMQSGQFDRVGDANEFKSRVKELASATADMTRAIHMTVSEVGTAMGNLRQMGVMSIASQKSIMMQVGGSAAVAGMSSPEMMQFAGSIGQQGMAMGLGAATTMPAAAQTLAAIRSMSQAGIISQSTLAMGGGAAAITGQIMGAEMRFATSNAGYLSQLGGGGRAGANTLSSMLGGLGAVSTFEGAMTFGLDKFRVQQSMSSAESSRLMENQFNTQLNMMGITDTTSHMAQGMVFSMAKQAGMDDAAASAYVAMHNTMPGRRAADVSTARGIEAARMREQAVLLDRVETFTSVKGQIRGSIQNVESLGASWADSGMRFIERSIGGDAAAGHARAMMEIGAGTRGVGVMSASDFADAAFGRSRGPENQVTTTYVRNHDANTFGAIAGGGALMAIGGVLGIASGGIVPALAISAVAFAGSSAVSTIIARDTQSTITGGMAGVVNDYQRLLLGVDPKTQRSKRIAEGGGLRKSEAYDRLQLEEAKGGRPTGDDMKYRWALAATVARENGIEVKDVVDYRASLGFTSTPADMVSITTGGGAGASASEQRALASILRGIDKGSDFSSSDASTALADYISARNSGSGVSEDLLRRVTDAGFGSDKRGIIDKNIDTLRSGSAWEYARNVGDPAVSGLRSDSVHAKGMNIDRLWRGVSNLVDSRVGGLGADDRNRYAAAKKNAKGDIIDSLLGSGAIHDIAMTTQLGSTASEIAALGTEDISRGSRSAEEYTRDLARRFHVDDRFQAGIYDMANTKGVTDDQMKKGLALAMANSAGEKTEESQTGGDSEAQMLHDAATILRALRDEMTHTK